MKRFAVRATLSLAAACSDIGPRATGADEGALPVQEANLIPGQYIVVLKASVPATQVMNAVVPMPGVEIRNVYVAALNGFAAKLSPEALEEQTYWDSLTFDVVKGWRVVHLPITLAFGVLALAHIIAICLFWGWH